VLGVGVLFPWNAFITAATYFGSRFCGTSHEATFEDDVGSAYMAANVKHKHSLPLSCIYAIHVANYIALFSF
jgi:hypothetical protein